MNNLRHTEGIQREFNCSTDNESPRMDLGTKDHICSPEQYTVCILVPEFMFRQYCDEPGYMDTHMRHASHEMANSILREASVFRQRTEGDVVQLEWAVNVILPGDVDSMWFIDSLARAKKQGRKEALADAAQVCRDGAERFSGTTEVCSHVLRNQCAGMAAEIDRLD